MLRLSEAAVDAWVALAGPASPDPAPLRRQAATDARFHLDLHPRAAARAWHAPILAVAAAQPGVAGITLGAHVYLRHADPSWPLLAHEVAHVAQALRLGTAPFLARYAAAWLRHRAAGASTWHAYRDLPDEVEARAIEARAARSPAPSRPLLCPTDAP
jgi:hypothetical protein